MLGRVGNRLVAADGARSDEFRFPRCDSCLTNSRNQHTHQGDLWLSDEICAARCLADASHCTARSVPHGRAGDARSGHDHLLRRPGGGCLSLASAPRLEGLTGPRCPNDSCGKLEACRPSSASWTDLAIACQSQFTSFHYSHGSDGHTRVNSCCRASQAGSIYQSWCRRNLDRICDPLRRSGRCASEAHQDLCGALLPRRCDA